MTERISGRKVANGIAVVIGIAIGGGIEVEIVLATAILRYHGLTEPGMGP